MAAPVAETTMNNLTGGWALNKTLSDSFDGLLSLQGIPWVLRKAVAYISVTEHVKQYTDAANITHIDSDQRISGGFKGGSENRILDSVEREYSNDIFGKMREKCVWMDPSDVEDLDEYLKEGWIGGDEEKAGPGGEKHMKVETVNEKGQWTVTAVWGFVNIEGARYHARKLVCRKGEQVERVRGVYSWKGKV